MPTRYADVAGLTPADVRKLNEIIALDVLHKVGDLDDDAWKCLAIIGHMWRQSDPKDVHLKVNALWQNGNESWIRADAM
jgi:hypothetical protein